MINPAKNDDQATYTCPCRMDIIRQSAGRRGFPLASPRHDHPGEKKYFTYLIIPYQQPLESSDVVMVPSMYV